VAGDPCEHGWQRCPVAVSFPNARIVVKEREVRFWTGPHAALGEYPLLASVADIADVLTANQQGRVEWADGDGEVVPGTTVHLVGGHTPGSQVVPVGTGGDPVVLAADASHFLANVEDDRPYAIVNHVPGAYLALRRLRELAGPASTIIPGHDPGVMKRYDAPDAALEGLAVRVA
jgi:glyoxylase-like metal-dependent hydrolase (beta-lactamase superfamily II)